MNCHLESFYQTFPQLDQCCLRFTHLDAFIPVTRYPKKLLNHQRIINNGVIERTVGCISIDDFIKLELLSSAYTQVLSRQSANRKFYLSIQKLLTHEHLNALIEHHKFDPHASCLDLSHIDLSDEMLQSLVNATPKLKNLKLNNLQKPQTIPSLLSFISKLDKIEVHLSFFYVYASLFEFDEGFASFFENFIIEGEKKTLAINLEKTGFELQPEGYAALLEKFSHLNLRVIFRTNDEKLVVIDDQICTLYYHPPKLEPGGSHYVNDLIPGSFPLNFPLALVIFKSSTAIFSPQIKFLSRQRKEHYVQPSIIKRARALKFEIKDDFQIPDLPPISELTNLQRVTLVFKTDTLNDETFTRWSNIIIEFDNFLSSTSIEMSVEGTEINLPQEPKERLSSFIEKAKIFLKCISHYNPFLSPILTNELKGFITEQDLFDLKPPLLRPSFIDFSGMSRISGKTIIDFLSDFPSTVEIGIESQRLIEEFENKNLSLDELVTLETLKRGYSQLLSTDSMLIRTEIKDHHFKQLFIKKKIDQEKRTLDLSGMCHLTLEGFEFILKQLPRIFELTLVGVSPNLYHKLPELAHIYSLNIPIEILRDENFKLLLNQGSSYYPNKCINLKCDHMPEMIPEACEMARSYSNTKIELSFKNIRCVLSNGDNYFSSIYLKSSTLKDFVSGKEEDFFDPLIELARQKPIELHLDLKNCSCAEAEEFLNLFCQKFADTKIEWMKISLSTEQLNLRNFEQLKKLNELKWVTLENLEEFDIFAEKLKASPLLPIIQPLNCSVIMDLKEAEIIHYLSAIKVMKEMLPKFFFQNPHFFFKRIFVMPNCFSLNQQGNFP